MNAGFIYKVFETAEQNGVDLGIALEILLGNTPLPDGVTKPEMHSFVGLHENMLSRAYQTRHPKLFADIVRVCEEDKQDEADLLMRAYATGNEKLIAEVEAKYGDHA